MVRARWATRRATPLPDLFRHFDVAARRGLAVESARRGVDGALRLTGRRSATCVPRSLALLALLSRGGHAATLVSGLRRADAGWESHAWVLVNGVPVGEPDQVRSYREQLRYDNRVRRQRAAAG